MAETPDEPRSRISTLIFDHAPRLLGLLTFLIGAAALISAAFPGAPAVERPFVKALMTEVPEITLTFGGLALMVLSLGLSRRLRTAWILAFVAAAHGLVATLVFHPRHFEALMYLGLVVLLIRAKKAFYRRSALLSIKIPRAWFLASFLSVAVAGFVSLLWMSHQKGFVEASFIDLVFDPILGVAGRPVAFALFVLAFFGFFLLVASPARTQRALPRTEDFARVRGLLEKADAPRPDNVLAFSGDKSFCFDKEQSAAIAFSEIGGARIAMGTPIGPKAHWKQALEAFRKDAEAHAARPAIYAAPPDLLPDLLDLGFKVEKIGENAILDLPSFTLSGRKREVIRRGRRKLAERAGATFRMSLPPHDNALLTSLEPTSKAWLAANGGREKAFSLGRFDPAFLAHCPIGIVEIEDQVVAFGTLFVTPDKSWAGIDLMRYDPEKQVTNTMDFLFVELILWAQNEGYKGFDLAMAPLSGLVEAEYAPLFARIGRLIFERGERIYNFQGLRRFKQKFDPIWEPRYIAVPSYWSVLVVLAKAALLTNGKKEEPAPAVEDEIAAPAGAETQAG
ncbi:MAG: phosphatidylglycerol lysyltransferase domain-containing protein [Pseudomonadota bacterium]